MHFEGFGTIGGGIMESYTVSQLSTVIAAVGAVGTAAFGLVDAFKALPGGGISRAGFKFIRQTILKLAPEVASLDGTGLGRDSFQSPFSLSGSTALQPRIRSISRSP